ncbi:MAG: hypothetical protein EOP92_03575 [Lysobacteraceae bacterium]|nr:MAG: hypothetical protein EOP92_03575 [Xanthomonadaceae bacterium]
MISPGESGYITMQFTAPGIKLMIIVGEALLGHENFLYHKGHQPLDQDLPCPFTHRAAASSAPPPAPRLR